MTTTGSPAVELATAAFRRVAGAFPTGVTVISALAGGVPKAMTANSFVTVSLDPPLVLVSVQAGSRMVTALRTGGAFAVSVLSRDQEAASRWFARPDRPEGWDLLAGFPWHSAPQSGSPVLSDSTGYFDCRVESVIAAGDHLLVLGRVLSLGELCADAPPLVFWRGGYRSVS